MPQNTVAAFLAGLLSLMLFLPPKTATGFLVNILSAAGGTAIAVALLGRRGC